MLRFFTLLYICTALSGCVVLVPFVEKDAPRKPKFETHSGCVTAQAAPKTAKKAVQVRKLTNAEKQQRLISKYVYNLGAQDTVVRIHAASYLGEMGPAARSAVNPLIRSLSDSHYWVRRTAAKSLGKIGDPRAVNALVERMRRDSDRYVNLSAANALRRIGTPEAMAAVQGYFN